jgi:hypothetical protein
LREDIGNVQRSDLLCRRFKQRGQTAKQIQLLCDNFFLELCLTKIMLGLDVLGARNTGFPCFPAFPLAPPALLDSSPHAATGQNVF